MGLKVEYKQKQGHNMVQAGFKHGPNKKVDTPLLWTFGHVDSILKHWRALATLEAKLLNFL